MIWKIALIVLGFKLIYDILFPDEPYDIYKPFYSDSAKLYKEVTGENVNVDYEHGIFYNSKGLKINMRKFYNDYYRHKLKSIDKYIIT